MPKSAPRPFDDTKADFQFLTSDNILFRVHHVVLALVENSIFADMLSGASDDGQPISVAENSEAFDMMLRFIYPGSEPDLEDLKNVNTILPLARKYEVQFIIDRSMKALVSPDTLKSDPYGAFAIVHNFKLADIAGAKRQRL